MKKTYLATILMFLLVFSVSASLNPQSATFTDKKPGDTVLGTFTITNDYGSDLTNVTFEGSISGMSTDFTFAPTQISTFNIGDNEIVDYQFNIPDGQLPGTYSGEISISGDNGSLGMLYETFDIDLTVAESQEITITPPATINVDSGESNSVTFDIKNTGNVDLSGLTISYLDTNFQDSEENQILLTFDPTTFSLARGELRSISLTAEADQEIFIGSYSGQITVSNSEVTETFNLEVKVGSEFVTITLEDEDNLEDLPPGDDFTLVVNVKNEVSGKDLDNVNVRAWVINVDGEDDLKEDSREDDIPSGDDQDFDIDFVLPLNVDDGDFDIKVRVDGEDEDGNKFEIFQTFRNILEIVKDEDEEVQFENLDLPVGQLTCGSIFTISIDAINTGDNNLRDMYFVFKIEGTEISIKSEEFDLDADDKKDREDDVDFLVTLPNDLTETSYNLKILAYNDDNELVGGEYTTIIVNPCSDVEDDEELEEQELEEQSDDNVQYLPTGFATGELFTTENLSLVFWGVGIIALVIVIIYFLTLLIRKK
ncbi:hypothetical protein K8R33_00135 [archaeon]|nr:hypothetical protein [archaeon]